MTRSPPSICLSISVGAGLGPAECRQLKAVVRASICPTACLRVCVCVFGERADAAVALNRFFFILAPNTPVINVSVLLLLWLKMDRVKVCDERRQEIRKKKTKKKEFVNSVKTFKTFFFK